jgi:hypothetical protein
MIGAEAGKCTGFAMHAAGTVVPTLGDIKELQATVARDIAGREVKHHGHGYSKRG